jgi:hypothetical protein
MTQKLRRHRTFHLVCAVGRAADMRLPTCSSQTSRRSLSRPLIVSGLTPCFTASRTALARSVVVISWRVQAVIRTIRRLSAQPAEGATTTRMRATLGPSVATEGPVSARWLMRIEDGMIAHEVNWNTHGVTGAAPANAARVGRPRMVRLPFAGLHPAEVGSSRVPRMGTHFSSLAQSGTGPV